MKPTTKVALAVSALSVPLGAIISIGGISIIAKKDWHPLPPLPVVIMASALPRAIAASTLAIKYQDKKYLLLNAISVIGSLQVFMKDNIIFS
uniref:Uncharacterized protein n=1 Tax=viral metagenome TaxID=1070528 RepID=A0A6C0K3I7_9ZZZZ